MIIKKVMKTLFKILVVIIALMIIFIVNGFFEYSIVKSELQEFKERAIYVGVDDKIENTYYYRVPQKYDYEDLSRNIFNFDTRWVGSKTDIIITNRNPMRDDPNLAGIIGFLSRNFYVGHATINSTDSGNKLYEVIGNSSNSDYNVVDENTNNWITIEESAGQRGDSPIIIGLRIKNTTSEQRDQIINYAQSKLGMPYNFSFFLNRNNSFYCTDLVSRATKSAGININYDYLATTGNDIIVSPNTYITFLRETVIENGIKRFNIYYLGNE